eukprot:gene25378-31833_t
MGYYYEDYDKNAPRYKYHLSDFRPDSDKMKRAREELDYEDVGEPGRKSHYEPRSPRSPRSPPAPVKQNHQTPDSSPGIQRGGKGNTLKDQLRMRLHAMDKLPVLHATDKFKSLLSCQWTPQAH